MSVHLTFDVADQTYAIGVESIDCVIEFSGLTKLPMAGGIKGIFNLRGQAVPVIDLKEQLGFGATDLGAAPSVIVLSRPDGSSSQGLLGALADRVNEVIDLSEGDISEAGSVGAKLDTSLVKGIARSGGSFIVCLDPAAL
jgi:purine-binding chemotaxis protein CheW